MNILEKEELEMVLGAGGEAGNTTDDDHWDPEHCDPDSPGDGCMPVKNPWG